MLHDFRGVVKKSKLIVFFKKSRLLKKKVVQFKNFVFVCSIRWISSAGFPQSAGFPRQTPRSTSETSWWSLCTPTGMLSEHDKQTLVMQADYCVVEIDGLNVYAPVGPLQSKLTRDHVVLGGKSRKTVKLGPIQSTTHPLLRGRSSFLLLLVPITLPLPRQVTLIFLLKCCPTVTS